ncbi:uncharacterized protein [Montipora foliosa]|uniref:uncharacterized protein n=1 Tax=Montipora foliosa TaxID=591990 RepID=UPI0035F1D96B
MLFTRDSIPASRSRIPKVSVAQEWEHLRPIADKLMLYEPDVEISLLIGHNCPSIVRPQEVVVGEDDDPCGQRYLMGWVCKSTNESDKSKAVCNKTVINEANEHFAFSTKVKEIINPQRIIKVVESDFVEGSTRSKSYSLEDKRFLSILENSIVKSADGHYEMPLPLKMDRLSLPYNCQLAVKRWHQLLARFKKNPKFLEDYQVFMKDFDGVCLNDYLLQGPDQFNTLLGILCRFRQERVAFMTDIKSMFHQFMVSEEHRDLLRFLWWEDGDPKKEFVEYRMKVHLFGAGSSPGCANFGLKKATDDGEAEYGKEAAEFIRRDFYVDDGLKSVGTIEEAVNLIKASQGICARAGLKLHKIMSNKREVLKAFPIEERAQSV